MTLQFVDPNRGLRMAIVPPLEQVVPRLHADRKHAREAVVPQEIRESIQDRRTDRLIAYFSPFRMTFLLLGKMLYLDTWGGWIFGAESLVELTAYSAPWSYWQRIIERDGYFPALLD